MESSTAERRVQVASETGAQGLVPVARLMLGLAGAAVLVVAYRHLIPPSRAAALRELGMAEQALIWPPDKSFHLCGKYCGDNWCNGQQMRESDCAKVDQPVPPDSCYDACCMSHDRCCVAGHDHQDCNREMLGCIRECKAAAFRERKLEHWLHCGAVLEAAMAAAQHCECGLCPTPGVAVAEVLQPGSTDQQRQEYLGQRERPGWIQLG
eukprot:scaffold5241_cov129-Isochrysis_galbana.AAC.2